MNTFFTEDLIKLFNTKSKSFKVEFTIHNNTINQITFKDIDTLNENKSLKDKYTDTIKYKEDLKIKSNRINAALIKYCLDNNIDDFRQFVSKELNIDLSEFEKRVLYYKEWKYIASNVVDKTYLIKGWFGKAGDANKVSKTKDEVYTYINDERHKVLKNIFEVCFSSIDNYYTSNI